MDTVVSTDVAKSEIEKWLNLRRVSEKKRESFQELIDELVEHVSTGTIVFDESAGKLIQKLQFPLGEGSIVRQLEFKPRILAGEIRQAATTLNMKAGDGDGRLLAHIAAATNQPVAMILKLDNYDYNIASNVALFFL
jgi:hypothetical protein